MKKKSANLTQEKTIVDVRKKAVMPKVEVLKVVISNIFTIFRPASGFQRFYTFIASLPIVEVVYSSTPTILTRLF